MTFTPFLTRRAFASLLAATAVAACASEPEVVAPPAEVFDDGYGPIEDSGYTLPGIPRRYTSGVNRRMEGQYLGEAPGGSIDVDPYAKFLYFVREDGTAIRYPVAVGRQGRTLSGRAVIADKRKWPGWQPTANMLRREPEVYGPFARGIPGGLRSPLGARALYIYRNGRDTHYRIHGTNDLESIGNSGSAGCIRMFNHDIIDLYERITIPMTVNIRSEAESQRVDPEYFNRGVELPPKIIDPDQIYGEEAVAADHLPIFDEGIANDAPADGAAG